MKKIIIPKGAIERYESIDAEIIVVHGTLIATRTIRCKQIYGNGTVQADKIVANGIQANILDATIIHAKKIVAGKIYAASVRSAYGIVAKDYLEAVEVSTARLCLTLSEVERIHAKEIIRLEPKERGFLGLLLASWVQEHLMFWKQNRMPSKKAEPVKAAEDFSDIDKRALQDYRKKCSTGKFRLVCEAIEA